MSKPSLPFWQPGDSWQPPIVRLHGVDLRTEEGQAVLAQHGGAIRQFYLGQARAHSLGTIDLTRGTKQSSDLDMRYTNSGGQEIVDVTIRAKSQQKPEPKKKGRMRPRWAVINFSAKADIQTGPIEMKVEIPRSGGAPLHQATATVTGYSHTATALSEMLQFASISGPLLTPGGSPTKDQYELSLRVDLRPFQDVDEPPIIAIDVYGLYERYDRELTGWSRDRIDGAGFVINEPGPWPYPQNYDFYTQAGDIVVSDPINSVTLANAPLPSIVQDWPGNPAFHPWQYVYEVQYHPESGLITVLEHWNAYADTAANDPALALPDGPWQLNKTRNIYTVSEDYGQTIQLADGPGRIAGRLFWEDPTWGAHETNINHDAAPDYLFPGFYAPEYVWAPTVAAYGTLGLIPLGPAAGDLTWPTPQESKGSLVAGDAGTKLGRLMVSLDPPSIAFFPGER